MREDDPYLPHEAEVMALTQESSSIFTLNLRFTNSAQHDFFVFYPGQFNMLYLYGVGEVAISIVSDPEEACYLSHTIRAVGRVTRALQQLRVGDRIGVRGPFGRGWPIDVAKGKDLIMLTGGLGCAPSVSVIDYVLKRRHSFGHLSILQGVKHSDDFIFKSQYDVWKKSPHTDVYIAADQAGPKWPWSVGYVTDLINQVEMNAAETLVMMCGPEMMMRNAVNVLNQRGVGDDQMYLSMERNMECGIGQCGHCQYGGYFICKDGPVFAYSQIKHLFNEPGF